VINSAAQPRQDALIIIAESTTTCGAGGLNFRPQAEKANGFVFF
jgi:hypothetical protein